VLFRSAKSRGFRQEARRCERRLRLRGFVPHLAASPDEVERGLDALERAHLQRWARRGGSRIWKASTGALLRDVERRLRGTGRFRLMMIDDGTHVISAYLSIAAGRHLSCWLGSFDLSWAKYKTGTVAVVSVLRDAFDQGYERADLGQGEHPFKNRLADGRQELAWTTFVPHGLAGIPGRIYLAPRRGARSLVARLPESVRVRLRAQVGIPTWLK